MDYLFAGENILVQPSNLQCACSNDQLLFTCIVIVQDTLGATIWSGSALSSCDGDRIQVRHNNLNEPGQCDGGAISARSKGIEDNCATSELTIIVNSTLNNKIIRCILNSNSGVSTIGEATINLVTGKYYVASNQALSPLHTQIETFCVQFEGESLGLILVYHT